MYKIVTWQKDRGCTQDSVAQQLTHSSHTNTITQPLTPSSDHEDNRQCIAVLSEPPHQEVQHHGHLTYQPCKGHQREQVEKGSGELARKLKGRREEII